jgi:hypothetical protein
MNIAQAKDGRGVVETVKGHIYVHGKAHLIVKWQGIEDSDANDNKINTLVEPKHLFKCKVAQDYLQVHGFAYGANGSCTKPHQPKGRPPKKRDADLADGAASNNKKNKNKKQIRISLQRAKKLQASKYKTARATSSTSKALSTPCHWRHSRTSYSSRPMTYRRLGDS